MSKKDEVLKLALEALEQMQAMANFDCWNLDICDEAITAIREALAEQPAQPSKPLTDERPVSTADELPSGFVPLQKENGRIVYAACMDSSARHYKWLMWRHPDGQWVSKRKLEDWEVMQVEDQEHYGIVQEAAHGIKEKNNG